MAHRAGIVAVWRRLIACVGGSAASQCRGSEMRGPEDVRAPVASEEPQSGYKAVGVGSNIKKWNRTGRLALVLTDSCWKLLDNRPAEDLAVSLPCSASVLQVAWSCRSHGGTAPASGPCGMSGPGRQPPGGVRVPLEGPRARRGGWRYQLWASARDCEWPLAGLRRAPSCRRGGVAITAGGGLLLWAVSRRNPVGGRLRLRV